MANDARLFMRLHGPAGTIRGECRLQGLEDTIEVLRWNWRLDAGSQHADRQAVLPSVLTLLKPMDRASTTMLNAMRKADVLSASLQMREATLNGFHLGLALEKVRITHYELHAESDGPQRGIQERWTFDYDSVLFNYQPDGRAGVMQVGLTRPPGSPSHAEENALAAQEFS